MSTASLDTIVLALPRPLFMGYEDLSSKSDQDLMDLVQRRNEDAFELLVNRYFDRVYRFVYRLCGNPSDAEDIVQDTFYRVWSRASKWHPNRVKFTTWVHQIARNLYIDNVRKTKPTVSQTEADVGVYSDDLDAKTVTQTEVLRLREAIAQLPERQRTALILCQLQGWAVKEVAHVLETTVYGVDALLARAKRTLRNQLKERLTQ